MKKKNPELDFSPQANMLHLLKSAKSMALSSPKRNTVVLQPNILDVMTGKGNITLLHAVHLTVYILNNIYHNTTQFIDSTLTNMAPVITLLTRSEVTLPFLYSLRLHI